MPSSIPVALRFPPWTIPNLHYQCRLHSVCPCTSFSSTKWASTPLHETGTSSRWHHNKLNKMLRSGLHRSPKVQKTKIQSATSIAYVSDCLSASTTVLVLPLTSVAISASVLFHSQNLQLCLLSVMCQFFRMNFQKTFMSSVFSLSPLKMRSSLWLAFCLGEFNSWPKATFFR